MNETKITKHPWVIGLLVIIFMGVLASVRFSHGRLTANVASDPATTVFASESTDTALAAANCRYGVGYVPPYYDSLSYIPTLGAGWFVNFSPYEPPVPTAQFVYTVRLKQLFGANGARLHEYSVFPPLVYSYTENGQWQPGLGWFIEQKPGALWMIGNEIEIENNRQDNIMPDLYAEAYHKVYHYIKSVDPTAQVAIGAVTMGTPGRLQYLDIIWDTYKKLYGVNLPVDVWNFHIYILAERTAREEPQHADGKIALGTDPNLAIFATNNRALCPPPTLPDTTANDPRADVYCKAEHDSVRIFREQVYNMRRWMKEHGMQNKPLIISEYGTLYSYINGQPDGSCERRQDEFGRCFYPERVRAFLEGTVDFMENAKDPALGYPADENRLLQRWLWYSIYTGYLIGDSANLLVDNYPTFPSGSVDALSPAGKTFRTKALANGTTNLVADDSLPVNVFVNKPGDKTSAILTATFHNGGTMSVVKPFTVTFYSDAALTRRIGAVTVDPASRGPIEGCAWIDDSHTASVTWEGLGVGTYPYWAKIDTDNAIAETSESDNTTTQGVVTVYSNDEFAYNLFLPVSRGD